MIVLSPKSMLKSLFPFKSLPPTSRRHTPTLTSLPILLLFKVSHCPISHPPWFSLLSQWAAVRFAHKTSSDSLEFVFPSQSYASCGKSKYRKMTTCTLMLVRMSSLYSAKCLPRGSLKDT